LACSGVFYYKRQYLTAYAATATTLNQQQQQPATEFPSSNTFKVNVLPRKDLPTYRLDEVKKHGKSAERIWVTFQQGVYDITDFIEGHPGGNKILMAAGGSIEPYWHLYQQHENEETYEMLEELRIGNLDPRDVDKDDLYANDPLRHPALQVLSQKPFNAETPSQLLIDHFYTPNPLFFVRSHMPVPKTHRVEIDGIGVKKPLSFNVDELKKQFEVVSVSATLQCAGNRRADMSKEKTVQGLPWKGSAISNAKWTGVRLRDVLVAAGVDPNDKRIKHVHFEGADHDTEGQHFGSSISFEKAMKSEVLLAFMMNDEEIPLDHGYPLRLVAPGIAGVRNVKWLKKIRLSDEESPAFWQQKDYKFTEKINYDAVPAIQEYPVQSAFVIPSENITVKRGLTYLEVAGYAWSGGGRGIIRVEVSADGGNTWQRAELEQNPDEDLDHMWSWTFFRATIQIPPNVKEMDLVCKATDRSYNTQPETARGTWNVRGLLNNAWHHIKVNVV
uniref:sulfite oxidase n=1 Tax=Syphacia muris TaxID=451379 RepID=A0A0N5APD5_9BILA